MSKGKAPKDFEEAVAELEQIVSDMESGRITLEDSLAKFERGSFLIEHCRKVLGAAEQKIETLTRAADGTVKSEPMPTEDE